MFLRFLIWSILLFFLARFLWRVISSFLEGNGGKRPSEPQFPNRAPSKPTETFTDVRDAKFVDVPKSSAEEDSQAQEEK